MIVIEGCDGAGKTTLATHLGRITGLQVSGSRGPEGVRERTYEALGNAVKGHGPVVIQDRFYFSEIVYGSVLRGEAAFSQDEQAFIEDMLLALKCPIIFCHPSLALVRENVYRTAETQYAGKDHVVPHIEKIWGNYDKIARRLWRTNTKIQLYNYQTEDPIGSKADGLLESIGTYLEKRRQRTW